MSKGIVVLMLSCGLLLQEGCTPAVSSSASADGDGGDGPVAEVDALLGRYGFVYQTDDGIGQLGSMILEEGGEGEFLPGWICDEVTRYPLRWVVEEADSGAVFRVTIEDAMHDSGAPIVVEGDVGDCLDSALTLTLGDETWPALALPTDGSCQGGIVGVVCGGVPCYEDLAPACAEGR